VAETIVYGCDWCGDIVPKSTTVNAGTPKYAARVVIEQLWPHPALGVKPVEEHICTACRGALEALRQGRYRRG
jgi:hypothetical protein